MQRIDDMTKKRRTGSAAERMLGILHAMAGVGAPASLGELTDAVGLPKPTVYRLLQVLERTGHAKKEPGGRRYVPGPALRELATAVIRQQTGQGARHLILQRLADVVGEACNIVMLDGSQMTYIDRVDTAWPLRVRLDVGSHVPLHCTATGKLLLSLQPKRVRDRLMHAVPLQAYTPQTITDADELEAALRNIRRDRVGTDDQEFLIEMAAVAVPIDAPHGTPIAAISIHAPVFRRPLDQLLEFLPQLREAARSLSDLVYAGGSTNR